MPWLCAEDIGTAVLAGEDVVKNELQWDDDEFSVEEYVDADLESEDDQAADNAVKIEAEGVVKGGCDKGGGPVGEDKGKDQSAAEGPA